LKYWVNALPTISKGFLSFIKEWDLCEIGTSVLKLNTRLKPQKVCLQKDHDDTLKFLDNVTNKSEK